MGSWFRAEALKVQPAVKAWPCKSPFFYVCVWNRTLMGLHMLLLLLIKFMDIVAVYLKYFTDYFNFTNRLESREKLNTHFQTILSSSSNTHTHTHTHTHTQSSHPKSINLKPFTFISLLSKKYFKGKSHVTTWTNQNWTTGTFKSTWRAGGCKSLEHVMQWNVEISLNPFWFVANSF